MPIDYNDNDNNSDDDNNSENEEEDECHFPNSSPFINKNKKQANKKHVTNTNNNSNNNNQSTSSTESMFAWRKNIKSLINGNENNIPTSKTNIPTTNTKTKTSHHRQTSTTTNMTNNPVTNTKLMSGKGVANINNSQDAATQLQSLIKVRQQVVIRIVLFCFYLYQSNLFYFLSIKIIICTYSYPLYSVSFIY